MNLADHGLKRRENHTGQVLSNSYRELLKKTSGNDLREQSNELLIGKVIEVC